MSSYQVKHDQVTIDFTYIDSGAPHTEGYTTFIIFHGHTFNSGTFKHLLPLAPSHKLRIICVNRREYAGTTGYTERELAAIRHGSDADRQAVMEAQGLYLALLIDGLIDSLDLPESGGIAVGGWSLGSLFLLSFLASVDSIPPHPKARLQAYIKTAILLDPPTFALGVASPPDPYLPLWDESLPPAERGPAFGKWVASYFKHSDLFQRNHSLLSRRDPNPSAKEPFITSLSDEELHSITDFAPGDKCDTAMIKPDFMGANAAIFEKAVCDEKIRSQWTNLSQIWDLYCDASIWSCVYQGWVLQERIGSMKRPSGAPALKFRVLEGASHFPFWDEPERFVSELVEMVKS